MSGWLAVAMLSALTAVPHKSVIVVGVNKPFDDGQAALRYADDDAARFFEILEPQTSDLQLLTVLDAESQELYPHAAKVAKEPTRAELTAALERAFAQGEQARLRGRRSEIFFIYTGHGRLEGGEGQVRLADSALSRTELAQLLLRSKAHDRIHLIVDACNAYHLVAARGDERVTADFDAAFEAFVEAHSLDEYPRVGVVLSTSGAGATHEWSRYQGGVFSHEVRSALTGAADANEDGHVDYTELEAFLAAANLAVPVPKGRPRVFVRPPAIERKAPLLQLERDLPTLTLSDQVTGHYYLEDDRGLRYAELNKASGHTVQLRLIPRTQYALMRNDGAEVARFDAPTGTVVVNWPLPTVAPARTERGGAEPPGAFAEAYGPAFVDGFRARLLTLSTPAPDPLQATTPRPTAAVAVGVTAAGVAAVATGLAIWQGVAAQNAYDDYQAAHRDEVRDAFAADVRASQGRAIGLGVTAGAAAVGSLLVFLLWD